MKTPMQRLQLAFAKKDWKSVDAELARFSRYMGKQVGNPKLDDLERAGVFALGFAAAAARRLLPVKKK